MRNRPSIAAGARPSPSAGRNAGQDSFTPSKLRGSGARSVERGHEVLVPPGIVNCTTEKNFISEAARLLVESIRESISTEGPDGAPTWNGKYAIVGLSGGTTPRPIYQEVANYFLCEGNQAYVDWTRVIIFLVDERYAPSTSDDSNSKMVKDSLLFCNAVPERNFIYPDTSLPLEECREEYDRRLEEIFSLSRPTVVVLGVGADGHLASWFPPLSADDSFAAYDPYHHVCVTHQDKYPGPDRITVSMHLILSAKTKLIFIKGEDKITTYKSLVDTPPTQQKLRQEPLLQVLRSQRVTVVAFPPLEKNFVLQLQTQWKKEKQHLSIIVLGSSGDLAKKKTFPALFSLFCSGFLPSDFHIAAYARSAMTVDSLFESLTPHIQKLSAHFALKNEVEEEQQLAEFKLRFSCHKCSGYDSVEDARSLGKYLVEEIEKDFIKLNRIVYLALPPDVFSAALASIRNGCWSEKGGMRDRPGPDHRATGWNRVIVEKPFGRDSQSSAKLSREIALHLKESEIFRIDHYLGKEMVLNLLALRFANVVFETMLWRKDIKCIRITLKETGGTQGRGGYFDNYGIIRDVIQNHLLQIVTLLLMERPVSLADEDVTNEKVKVLRATRAVCTFDIDGQPIHLLTVLEETVIGQYGPALDGETAGYTQDETVPSQSKTPTFATLVLHVDNERFSGVPIIIKAGKALETQITEVRVQFRPVCSNLFDKPLPENELVIRIQPSDAIYLKCIGKRPGLAEDLVETELDLSVSERLQVDRVNDAYERLLLDVIKGDQKNFVHKDELQEAWRIFTPLLQAIESKDISPIVYPAGSRGPPQAYDLIHRFGYSKNTGYVWQKHCS